jgi:hypothetical protein
LGEKVARKASVRLRRNNRRQCRKPEKRRGANLYNSVKLSRGGRIRKIMVYYKPDLKYEEAKKVIEGLGNGKKKKRKPSIWRKYGKT